MAKKQHATDSLKRTPQKKKSSASSPKKAKKTTTTQKERENNEKKPEDYAIKPEELAGNYKNKSKILESLRRKHQKKASKKKRSSSSPNRRRSESGDEEPASTSATRSPLKKLKAAQPSLAVKTEPKLDRVGGGGYNNSVEICTDTDVALELSVEEKALFDSLIYTELDANGGAYIMYSQQEELDERLVLPGVSRSALLEKFAIYFLKRVYSESPKVAPDQETNEKENEESGGGGGKETPVTPATVPVTPATMVTTATGTAANYALGYVRNSGASFPPILDYFAEKHPDMIVKSSLLLNGKEINTLRMSEYHRNVNAAYSNGTYRYGPLLQTSIVGTRNEEIGDYFPDFIENVLERNPFLVHVMPWGSFSVLERMNPMNSDDGPILWARPGEQMIPTSSLKDQQLNAANPGSNASSERKK